MIGFAPQSAHLNNRNFDKRGWYLNSYTGNLYSQNGDLGRAYYEEEVEEGHVVQVNHNRQENTISFIINGVDKGVAYKNVPADIPLYPCVEMAETTTVELID
eukprot:TRINITY_DN9431_c0_g2_i1.p1 TRINITY_DN9431_c0_g2~~TRINITY_DN9431_c0_g2_i1.p1  ORF type:complete len:102 (+),score=28.95 TRINITY_DN9431_c0_g2_i1:92-397(+)